MSESSKKSSRRTLIVIGALFVTMVGGFVLVPLLVLISIAGGAAAVGCVPGGGGLAGTYTGPPIPGYNTQQMSRAAAIVSEGRRMGITDHGIVVALATASQESGFRVYANDGVIQYDDRGQPDLAPEQRGVGASLKIPHDSVGTDHGSLGVFQQQWPWWGSMEDLMDPTVSARKFYQALLKVDRWETLPVTVAAQSVQVSAYPSAYADDEPIARQLLKVISANLSAQATPDDQDTDEDAGVGPLGRGKSTGSDVKLGNSTGSDVKLENGVIVSGLPSCPVGAAGFGSDKVVFPLPADSGYVDNHSYGRTGSSWAAYHTGNDYSVACGTPVYAVTSGTVNLASGGGWAWSGKWMVQIQVAGAGSLTTWYAHMQSISVKDGQVVAAGQQIGEVGNLGNVSGPSGCHLHLEVHPQGGGYLEDDVDPAVWLAKNIGKTTPGGKPGGPGTGTPGVAGTQLPGGGQKGTGQTLGALPVVHAQAGGTVKGTVRMAVANLPERRAKGRPGSLRAIAAKKPDFIALNEVAWTTKRLTKTLPGYGAYRDPAKPGTPGTRQARLNVVMWNARKWDLVDGGQFMHVKGDWSVLKGRPFLANRYATWAVLKRRSDGAQVVVVSTHNMTNPQKWPSRAGRVVAIPGNPKATRIEQYAHGMGLQRAMAKHLSAYGPVLLGGDQNVHRKQGAWSAPDQLAADGYGSVDDGAVIYQFHPLGTHITGTSKVKVASDHRNALVSDIHLSGYSPSVVGAPPTSPTMTPGSLTVLTYNLHGTPSASDRETLAQELDGAGAEVIALQDVDGPTAQWLAQRLGMQVAYAKLGKWKGKDLVDNAILARYPIHDPEVITLPTPDGTRPRAMLHATLGVSKGVFVDIYATHLGGSSDETLAQAERVAGRVDNSNCGALLVGHMSPLTRAARDLLTEDLADTFSGKHKPTPTSPAKNPSARPDYVFHDPATKPTAANVLAAGLGESRAIRVTFDLATEDCT